MIQCDGCRRVPKAQVCRRDVDNKTDELLGMDKLTTVSHPLLPWMLLPSSHRLSAVTLLASLPVNNIPNSTKVLRLPIFILKVISMLPSTFAC